MACFCIFRKKGLCAGLALCRLLFSVFFFCQFLQSGHFRVFCFVILPMRNTAFRSRVLVKSRLSRYNGPMKKNETTSTAEETVTISRAEYEYMQNQISWLTEQLIGANKKLYGSSAEKATEEAVEQMSFLFNEAEVYEDKRQEREQSETTTVKEHTRRRSGSVRDIVPEDIEVRVVEHRLGEEERICPECGTVMVEIGKEEKETLKLIPARAWVQKDVYYTYACMECKQNNIETPMVKTPREAAVIPGSFASPEAIAEIMVEKFVMYSPLYRQEQAWKSRNILLTRQTMSNWLVRSAMDWLKPVCEELHRKLLSADIIHADETEVQVLHEPGKKATAKSYMWMYRTGKHEAQQIVLYEYRPGRGGQNPKRFLDGFCGYLQTDGYAGYHAVEDVTHVGCWAHARRKFKEAVDILPKGRKTGAAVEGEAYCDRLFSIEETLSELPPEERYKKRRELEKPVLDAMEAWASTRSAAPKSKLGQALHYLKEQWPNLVNYLMDGRLELSNNLAERSIKPFVMGRKNFLFMNTPGGAEAGAVIYSMIETAKANGLDPYCWLTYLLQTAPGLDRSDPDWVLPLLPENAPPQCRNK